MKKILEVLFLINFILTFVFMCMHNLLFLVTFGIIFILVGLNIFEILNDTDHTVKHIKEKYENYNLGIFQQKISKKKEKMGKHVFLAVGFSLCMWYIFYLLIKYDYYLGKYFFAIILPLNISFFPIYIGIELIYIALQLKKHKDNYNIKVLAECIEVHESVLTQDMNDISHKRTIHYIVTYSFNYNNQKYIVSNIEPKPYNIVPICGKKYEIYINDKDPNDFDDDFDKNIEIKLNFSVGILFIVIPALILIALISVWLKYL